MGINSKVGTYNWCNILILKGKWQHFIENEPPVYEYITYLTPIRILKCDMKVCI